MYGNTNSFSLYLDPALSLVKGVRTADTVLLPPLHLFFLNRKKKYNSNEEKALISRQITESNTQWAKLQIYVSTASFTSCLFVLLTGDFPR